MARKLRPAHWALHARLGALRSHAGWPTVREVSDGSGVSHETVYNAFEGRRLPHWKSVASIVRALGGDEEAFRPVWRAARRELLFPERTYVCGFYGCGISLPSAVDGSLPKGIYVTLQQVDERGDITFADVYVCSRSHLGGGMAAALDSAPKVLRNDQQKRR